MLASPPISETRSVTAMYMTLRMLTAATRREIPPIPRRKTVIWS